MLEKSRSFIIVSFLFTLIGIAVANTASGQTTTKITLEDFEEEGWQEQWMERKIVEKATDYRVVQEDSNHVLMATSEGSASLLWRMLDIKAGDLGSLSWRWKVEETLSKNTQEKKKLGDDYAARLYLVFEPHLISWKTRAICYVWAAAEPTGSVYTNPYASSLGMIVVESGNDRRGDWIEESRDFVADYRELFGEQPEFISAVAIMVDTENSDQKARALFDDIVLQFGHSQREQEIDKSTIRFDD